MVEKNCVIVFDRNEYGTYFTGQVVTGKVMITFHKAKKLKGIKLQICGFAVCQWRDRHGKANPIVKVNPKKRRRHVFLGREDYIASTTFLIGAEEGQNFTMDAGVYNYAFSCPIPLHCPSSFEGQYGHIRYLAKVTFIKSGCSNRTQNVGFTVLRLLDLNKESNILKAPASNDSMESFCFLHSKAVHLKVDLMQTGYVPGQIILVSAHVNNAASVDCKRLLIFLNLRATYTSDTPYLRTSTEKICLVKKVCGPVPHGTEKDFAETIRVPATPPTSEHLCKVLRITYEICVVAVMNPFMFNPKTVIPITIGNIPLTTGQPVTYAAEDAPTTSNGVSQESTENESDFEDVEAVDCEEAAEEIEMPPPTYEEAMFMTTDIADTDANTVSETAQFTPRYPVYDVDNLYVNPINGQGPPPNLPKKRRRRRKKQAPQIVEKPPRESPVMI